MLFLGLAFFTADEEDVEQVVVVRHVEALERAVAQGQCGGVGLEQSFLVGMSEHVLQPVGLFCQLALGVELEDVEIVVVPIVDTVLEGDAVLFLLIVHVVHTYLHVFTLAWHIDIEETAHRERLYSLSHAVLHFHVVAAGLPQSVVDAEAEQTVVAHGPELPLLFAVFHVS